MTFVRAAVLSRTCSRSLSRIRTAASLGLGRVAEHELPTGHRIVTGRDADLVGAAPLADAGQVRRRLLPACHNGSIQRVNGQPDGQRSSNVIFVRSFTLVRGGAPPGTRTPNPLILGPPFRLVADSCGDLAFSRF